MDSPHPAFRIEELLAHADWLRRLARHVVRGQDGAAAEDAVQETWVAAMRAPPRRDRAAEPWLAEVLRNFARRALRTERARKRHEEQADGPLPAAAAAASPELLLERAQAQRLLVGLVVALDEPYRSTVLLRYFEGLSAADIARTQEIPAGTVRWRLREGLQRLRAALEGDARAGRDLRAWALLFSPLGRPRRGLALGWKGGLLLATATPKKIILGAMGLLLLALVGGGLLWRGTSGKRGGPSSERAAAAPGGRQALRPPPVFVRAIVAPSGELSADDSAAGSVEGTVVSAGDGSGVGGAALSFSFREASLPVSADAQGRFRFVPGEPGVYRLAQITATGYQPFSPEWGDSPIGFALRAHEQIRGVKLALQPARTCHGQVVDRQGKPVAGAHVLTYVPMRAVTPAPVETESDSQGAFTFIAISEAFVEAREGGRMAREQVGYRGVTRCAVRLQLGPVREPEALAISGRIEGAGGAPLAGAILHAWVNPVLEANAEHAFAHTLSGEDGRFQLGPLDGIPYQVTASVGGQEVASAGKVRGGTHDLVLRVAAPGRLRGKVEDAEEGKPVVSFSVVLSRGSLDDPLSFRTMAVFTRHDARGVFELDDVPAGSYQALVTAQGRAPSDEQSVEVLPAPAPATLVRFVLRGGSKAHGRVIDRVSRQPLAAAKVGLEGRAGIASSVPLSAEALSDEEGRFELRGVPAGRVSLLFTAGGHNGRILGGLDTRPGQDLGPLVVDLAPVGEGQEPRLELVGIGATMAPRDGVAMIGQLTPDGAGARAGLVPGDAVVAVDGHTVAELGFGTTIQQIRGAEGTPVLLRVRHADGREEDMVVVRRALTGP